MFDIGWPELLVVAIVLIIVVGPKDLPAMLRAFGRTTTKLRGMASEFRGQFDEALKEADLDDVRKTINEARSLNPMNQIRDAVNPLKQAGDDIKKNLKDSVIREKPTDKADEKSAGKSAGDTGEKATKSDKPFVVPESGLKLSGDAPKIDASTSTKASGSVPVTALSAKAVTKPAAKTSTKAKSATKAASKTASPSGAGSKKTAAKPTPTAKTTAAKSTVAKTKSAASSPGKSTAKSAAATKAASKKGQA